MRDGKFVIKDSNYIVSIENNSLLKRDFNFNT